MSNLKSAQLLVYTKIFTGSIKTPVRLRLCLSRIYVYRLCLFKIS